MGYEAPLLKPAVSAAGLVEPFASMSCGLLHTAEEALELPTKRWTGLVSRPRADSAKAKADKVACKEIDEVVSVYLIQIVRQIGK